MATVKKAKRDRIDSTSEQVKVMAASAKGIGPPSNVPLSKKDMPFFVNVLDQFARSDWTAHDLEVAAMLARSMCDLNEEQQILRTEGYITARQNGTTVENPRLRVVKSLSGDLLSFRRSLSLHARAREGDARDVAKRRSMSKDIESNNPLDDDLLARPN